MRCRQTVNVKDLKMKTKNSNRVKDVEIRLGCDF